MVADVAHRPIRTAAIANPGCKGFRGAHVRAALGLATRMAGQVDEAMKEERAARLGSGAWLENAIGRVAIDAVDGAERDRVGGRILDLSPPPETRAHAD